MFPTYYPATKAILELSDTGNYELDRIGLGDGERLWLAIGAGKLVKRCKERNGLALASANFHLGLSHEYDAWESMVHPDEDVDDDGEPVV